ncbi:hypothetical protein ABEH62_09895 [Pantoea eucalypti]|uniref:hypothetical protein n=1 Tax=Pantoea eucalypti TaxID=470933 RepID=UPI001653FE35|nr:hypothetical protein [Pantoea eucalypti]
MGEGLTDSVKKVLEERMKNPLWGFIILAWLWFNWPNLAMLFMSDAPVKFRIDYILSQKLFYLHYMIVPILSGSLLAIVSPYAQWLLSQAHKWADDRYSDNIFKVKEKNYQEAIKLSTLKVQADRAEELAKAKADADIQEQKERGRREMFKTEEMESIKKALEDELENLRRTIALQESDIDMISKEKAEIQHLIVKSLTVMEKFFKIDNSSSIQELRKEVEKLYSAKEIEFSTIFNALDAHENLTDGQALTFLDALDDKVKKDKIMNSVEKNLENK